MFTSLRRLIGPKNYTISCIILDDDPRLLFHAARRLSEIAFGPSSTAIGQLKARFAIEMVKLAREKSGDALRDELYELYSPMRLEYKGPKCYVEEAAKEWEQWQRAIRMGWDPRYLPEHKPIVNPELVAKVISDILQRHAAEIAAEQRSSSERQSSDATSIFTLEPETDEWSLPEVDPSELAFANIATEGQRRVRWADNWSKEAVESHANVTERRWTVGGDSCWRRLVRKIANGFKRGDRWLC